MEQLEEMSPEPRPRGGSRERAGKRRGKSSSASAARGAIHSVPRADVELVWTDKGCSPDTENGKPIRCRQILARARLVQVLITLDVYEERRGEFEAAWSDLLATLRVAVPRDLMGGVGN